MRSAKAKTKDLTGRTQQIAFKLACPQPPPCQQPSQPTPTPEDNMFFNEEEGVYNGYVYRDGSKLFYRLAGKKSSRGTWPHKWVMLAHGFGASSRSWVPLMLYLQSKGWNSFAMDLRGHGDSDKDTSDPSKYTIMYIANDFHFTIHKLELVKRPYVFLGHSAGGILTQEYVILWPEEISHLLLASTTPKL